MKIKFVCHTGFAGASHQDTIEYDEGVWESLSDKERD